jgi:uncharacterized DUF497 family protein
MRIDDIVWLPRIVEKLESKHDLTADEVEAVLSMRPRIRLIERGSVEGEHLYSAQGTTDSGRYLIVFFIHKRNHLALIVSARDMDQKERRSYERK